jgi:hypothetical protein
LTRVGGNHAVPLIAYPYRAFYDPLQQHGEFPLAREQRKLAAILATDVVGYSRLMGKAGRWRYSLGPGQCWRHENRPLRLRRSREHPAQHRVCGWVWLGEGFTYEYTSDEATKTLHDERG